MTRVPLQTATISALLAVTLVSCASTNLHESLKSHGVKMPSVRIKDVGINRISLRDIDLMFHVEIANPYPINLKLEKVTFKVDVEQKQLFTVSTPSGFTIKARGAATTPLLLNLEYAKIIGIVRDFTAKDSLLCDISGELHIPLPKGLGLPPIYKYPFKVSQKIPAIKPRIAVKNFKARAPTKREIQAMIEKTARNLNARDVLGAISGLLRGKPVNPASVGLDDLDLPLRVSFDIELKNDARAKIAFDRLSYDFAINGEPVFKGDSNKTRSVGDTLVIRVVNELSSKRLGKGVLAVFRNRSGKFRIQGKASIRLPAEIANAPVELSFDEDGGFRL